MTPAARDLPALRIVTEDDPAVADAQWAEPELGFWVAARNGDFVGTVTAEGASYVARDATGARAGAFETLAAAQWSLTGIRARTETDFDLEETRAADRRTP